MGQPTRTVVVGRIRRAHGIRGELGVEIRTDEPDRRFARGAVLLAGSDQLTIASTRHHQGKLLVRFEEVGDRTQAEQWHGRELSVVVAADETPAEDDAFYDHQLIGLTVVTDTGRHVGTVAAVQHLDHQDLLTLDIEGQEVLVPFVAALVPHVDLAMGQLCVNDVPGLLDPDAADEV